MLPTALKWGLTKCKYLESPNYIYSSFSYLDQNARKLGNFAHRFALQVLDELFESGTQVDQVRGNSLLEMASRLYKDFSGDSSFYYKPMTEGNSQQLSHYIKMKETNDTAEELSNMILFITDSKLVASQGNKDLFDELHHFSGVAFKGCPTIDEGMFSGRMTLNPLFSCVL